MTVVSKFKHLVRGHTPNHKTPYEVKNNFGIVEIRNFKGDENKPSWMEITLEETYLPVNGKRTQNNSITIVVKGEQHAELIEMLK